VLARADKWAASLVSIGIVLTAGPLLAGPPGAGNPGAFVVVAPVVGVVGLFVALVAMFLERERRGVVRGLLLASAIALAICAMAYAGSVSARRLLAFYWAPAILSLLAAMVLVWGKRAAQQP
jgi:hypothetical protein